MEKIIRSTGGILPLEENSRNISGYAAIFNSQSVDLGFFETLERGCITQEMVDSCDVFARFNHEDDKILARSNHGEGSLKLTVDDVGLRYEFEAPNTELGNTLLEHIKRGDLNKSSFCFGIKDSKDSQKWEKRDGKYYRTIYRIDAVYDIAPVWSPAYQATSCDQRNLDEIKNLEAKLDGMMQDLLS